ncbi:CLUMA_CG006378, isoform A [Clunio marinus]|uniref:CLUMA_CG006378, isoform A n=1 Tax=Clunio marinus TaxID=568069 RepID=A0A1J1HYS6_9DIPT|nr:CLUMA_CG006378, isoform A [Clunio marinus]
MCPLRREPFLSYFIRNSSFYQIFQCVAYKSEVRLYRTCSISKNERDDDCILAIVKQLKSAQLKTSWIYLIKACLEKI